MPIQVLNEPRYEVCVDERLDRWIFLEWKESAEADSTKDQL